MAAKKSIAERGVSLLTEIMGKLTGPESPIGEALPLDAAKLRAVEDAAGVALSPSLHAVLSYDAGWLTREYRWFDESGAFLARPTFEIIAEHAGPMAEGYEEICAKRFPGKAIALDQGSDSMRFLYFGDPDEHGEYPVLFIDHDDLPMLGVEVAGFDLWLAEQLGVKVPSSAKAEIAETSKRILGSKKPWSMEQEAKKLPAPKPGPKPGSVTFTAIAPPPAGKPRKLSDKQLSKALCEIAEQGNAVRLATLIDDAKARKFEQKVFDDALVAAARGGRESTMRLLLAAGADPNAKEYYGAAIARLVAYGHSPAVARVLLDAGASANGESVNGKTVLFEAIERDSLDMARLLLERGADPNHGDKNRRRPLHEAASESDDPALIDLLLDRGAEIEGGEYASTPLHVAIEHGHREVARRLLARGANPNAKTGFLGRTALHLAFERVDDAFAGELVRAGADRSIADERGLTFTEIYGPKGEDVRPLEIEYVPSAEEQQLTIRAKIAVTNRAALGHTGHPPLDAKFWVDLIGHGLAAGSMFDPTKSRASVVRASDVKQMRGEGFADVELVLAVAGVAPEFLRLIARKMLGSAIAFTGAGVMAALRAVGLSIRGERPGASAIDVRAWLADESVQLGAWDGELPFPFRVERGEPGLVVAPASATSLEPLQRAVMAWFATSDAWVRAPIPFAVMLDQDYRVQDLARYRFEAPAAPKGQRSVFPFAQAPAQAALRNAMRALHAKTKLREVVLTLP